MKRLSLLIAVLVFLSGCMIRKTPIPQSQRLLPAQTRTFPEILQLLAVRSQAVKSLKAARVVFQPSAGARKKNEVSDLRLPIDGYLLVNRPHDIHIHLSAPVLKTTLADMVSDGREYKLWSPTSNSFYVGKADESIQIGNLDLLLPPPKDMARALFIDISQYLGNPGKYRLFQTETVETPRSYYVVRVVDIESDSVEAQAREEIWIDRTNMEIVRQVVYGKEGAILTIAEFSGFSSSGDAIFPQTVTIHRPLEDVDLKITFVNAEPNADLPGEDFQLAQPEGSQLIQLPGSTLNR